MPDSTIPEIGINERLFFGTTKPRKMKGRREMSKQFWKIENNTLIWNTDESEAHSDNIEMSGLYCDYIVSYGVKDDGRLLLSQDCYFPMLRTIPNNTHATFCFSLKEEERPRLLKNSVEVAEYPKQFVLDGTLKIKCMNDEGFETERICFPSVDSRFAIELVRIRALEAIELTVSLPNEFVHSYGRGTKGVYISKIYHTAPQVIKLAPGETTEFEIFYTSVIANEKIVLPDGQKELAKRLERISQLCDGALVLQTGNSELDMMTRFAKLRAGESIFDTLTGKYHSPGGHSYYAATWCNDQVEYAGPYFALTGDKTAIEASLNAYRSYIPFMSDAYTRIPSSIIAEGLDIWEGAGDRGDAAMYLYGASLFCLYLGDRKIADELYGAIKWCAEYCERKKSPEGVICSDSDELENRFPTDHYANLSTSTLCYGGLVLASKLAKSLGDMETAELYSSRATQLASAIESYFGATLHGFETYRYSKGFDTLRAWICLPLCMGIDNRSKGTLDAMLSDYLWTEEGMLTCERSAENTSDTIWDRSTLYGMRCAFLMGEGDRMLKPLLDYCHKRLVCDRVPYAVEAYPEGAKRHLSGESALFVRVITEGMFGIWPESLDSFSFIPQLPAEVEELNLRSIYISRGCFDICINRENWTVCCDGVVIANGETDGKRTMIRKPLKGTGQTNS